MKTLLTTTAAALALMLATPAMASTISDVDHADVPNCTVLGPNADDCENLTMNAIYPPNGLLCSIRIDKTVDPVTLAVTYKQSHVCA